MITWIDKEIVAIKGNASFEKVNAELGEYCLPVEPLSAQKTISQFIKEGGIGYNSQKMKTLGSSIFQFSSTFSGEKFTYGSQYKTLYNAGYPLHRMIEGPLFSEELSRHFGRIETVMFPVKKAEDLDVSLQNGYPDQLHVADHASNVFFINEFGAELMGLEGEGIAKTCLRTSETNSKSNNEIWEKRFLEDLIPSEHSAMKFLTMKSRLTEIYSVYNENAQGLFFALCVHNGILLLISGKRGQLDTISNDIRQMPLTFEIRSIE